MGRYDLFRKRMAVQIVKVVIFLGVQKKTFICILNNSGNMIFVKC